jgi:hypothetical protein
MIVLISIDSTKNQVEDMNLASVVFWHSLMNFQLSYNAIVFTFVVLDLESVNPYYYYHTSFLNMTRIFTQLGKFE